MENYKPNSYKSKMENNEQSAKIERKGVKPIVSGTAKTKKKGVLTKFTDVFIQEDIDSVKSYILTDVLIPSGKKLILDIVNSILYPSGGGRSSSPVSRVQYTSYDSISSGRKRESIPVRRTYEYDDILFETRKDAELVIMGMDEILNTYEYVSVADMYDLAGIRGDHTDNKYGWNDIRSARVEMTRDGYVIKLPKARPIE